MESKITGFCSKVFDKLLDTTVWISGAIITIIMFMTVYEVISRKLFDAPTSWSLDLSTLGLLVAALLPLAWVLRRKAHVCISLVSDKLSPKNRGILGLITYSLALMACLVMVWQSIEITISAYEQNEMLFRSLVIPKVSYLWVFAFSFILLIIQLLRELLKYYQKAKQGELADGS